MRRSNRHHLRRRPGVLSHGHVQVHSHHHHTNPLNTNSSNPTGEPCTYTSATIPICAGSCDAASVYCAGAYSKVCCEAGSSCDYASSGLCTAQAFQFSSFSAPSIIVPSLTVPSVASASLSLPSVPSFTPFAPTATNPATFTEETPAATSESTVGEASVVVVTVTGNTGTSAAAITSDSMGVAQSTGVAPDGPRGLGKGLLEVVVGGVGLLVGL
ncbi:uncharacterized protein BDZ99DRAFT_309962 [Mytilinidion resinicola]|uniref:Uncharacterized protein n=1 Tax=Mytilinidion resinicola TaxID=574789 RepID=A0A6A6YP50_9PEZI|nr:uncharacterized protein BDZ99DRAFT_309962 [Mytilinidion resinicola]KAF2810353.1 hypothetical protein BDZ99DRAFT_309962 [Mytilinidion resinicola]